MPILFCTISALMRGWAAGGVAAGLFMAEWRERPINIKRVASACNPKARGYGATRCRKLR